VFAVSTTARRAVAAVVVLAVAGALVWFAVHKGSETTGGSAEPTTTTIPAGDPSREAESFFDAWRRRAWDEMAAMVDAVPVDFADVNEQILSDLRVGAMRFAPGRPVVHRPQGDRPARAEIPFRQTWTLTGLGRWQFDSTLRLVAREASGGRPEWKVDWSTETIHPELAEGFTLRRRREWPTRAPILDAAGNPLRASNPVVEVGVEPRRITDRDALARALAENLLVSRADLDAKLSAPGVRPDYFVPIARLAPAAWTKVRDQLLPVPGVIYRETTAREGAPPDFARQVLGRVGEITAEKLKERGAPYAVGDLTGFGGIEEAYESRLAGRPSGSVTLVDEFGGEVGTLRRFEGRNPEPVRTTLDPAIQAAAEQATASVTAPAALVAIDPATGEIRAVVSRPLDSYNRALTGRYAPGSTFKVVTTYALLGAGVTPSTSVSCPPSVVVGGKTFRNFEGEQLGTISFAKAFEESCNTAFIGEAERMGAPPLRRAATALGFGKNYEIGLPAFRGSFPEVKDRTENAAAAIGQGRVEVSAVHQASVAAAIGGGSWRAPLLVTDPVPKRRPAAVALDEGVLAPERDLMLQVVRSGTGTAAAVPGRVVRGKTGTAQFDPKDPNRTHAWFIGYVERASGPLAFAVVVEAGGVGGRVAAPIARSFVAALP
jgi:cell division protein FtsI/penicillin-binding protein 2